jgi:hypothetical protein
MEMGDLSRREIKRDKAVIGLFSHHGDGQQGGQRGPQGAVGKAVCLIAGRPVTSMVAASRPSGQLDRLPDLIMLMQETGAQAPELCAFKVL